MASETLTCENCGQDWTRERRRGRKPTRCLKCLGAILSPSNFSKHETEEKVPEELPNRSERLSERLRTIPEDIIEILTTDKRVDPEIYRRLEYIVEQIEGQRREADDINLLLDTARMLVQKHIRDTQRAERN